ncbi:hypothetical protein Stube_14310 [Streptomyces tubercidicus]|uniref:Uncharacterized protein n=1 Tax=Streptomyces tubercidicus TaxID=47759 RepID=A0A640UKY5_9ACTN|nr:hypothetical protein Stube_14310 [Streptomyces tubercidicus]
MGARDAVDGGQWFGKFFQETIDRHRPRVDRSLRGPRRGTAPGRGEQLRTWGVVHGQEAEDCGFISGAGWVAVVLEDVRPRRSVH